MKIALLIAVLGLAACGHKYEVDGTLDVSGTVKQEVSFENMTAYFTAICQQKKPGEMCYYPEVDTCIQCLEVDFLTKINGVGPTPTPTPTTIIN